MTPILLVLPALLLATTTLARPPQYSDNSEFLGHENTLNTPRLVRPIASLPADPLNTRVQTINYGLRLILEYLPCLFDMSRDNCRYLKYGLGFTLETLKDSFSTIKPYANPSENPLINGIITALSDLRTARFPRLGPPQALSTIHSDAQSLGSATLYALAHTYQEVGYKGNAKSSPNLHPFSHPNPALIAARLTEMIWSGLEEYIPFQLGLAPSAHIPSLFALLPRGPLIQAVDATRAALSDLAIIIAHQDGEDDRNSPPSIFKFFDLFLRSLKKDKACLWSLKKIRLLVATYRTLARSHDTQAQMRIIEYQIAAALAYQQATHPQSRDDLHDSCFKGTVSQECDMFAGFLVTAGSSMNDTSSHVRAWANDISAKDVSVLIDDPHLHRLILHDGMTTRSRSLETIVLLHALRRTIAQHPRVTDIPRDWKAMRHWVTYAVLHFQLYPIGKPSDNDALLKALDNWYTSISASPLIPQKRYKKAVRRLNEAVQRLNKALRQYADAAFEGNTWSF